MEHAFNCGYALNFFTKHNFHFNIFYILTVSFLITAKINDTVNFGEEEEDDNIIEFDEVSGDEDIENVSIFLSIL